MTALNDGRVSILLDKERFLYADLNAMEEFQETYGELENLVEVLNGGGRWNAVRNVLHILLREGAEDENDVPTEKEIGKLVNMKNFSYVCKQIFKSFSVANAGTDTTEPEEQEAEEHEKNAEAAVSA